MKNKSILLITLFTTVILILLLGCDEKVKMELSADEYSSERTTKRLADNMSWDYPVKPGTELWKSLESNEAKVEACQIPQNILEELSDSILLELCLNYPLLNDFYAFENYDKGIDKLIGDFNGIRELFLRENKSKVFLSKYNNLIINPFILEKEISNIAKGEYIVLISTIELLISRPEMQKGLIFSDQKNIMQEMWRAYEMKIEYLKYFQGLGLKTNLKARENIISIIEVANNINPYEDSYDENYVKWINEKTLEIISK